MINTKFSSNIKGWAQPKCQNMKNPKKSSKTRGKSPNIRPVPVDQHQAA